MAYLYFDESIRDQGGFIIGALVFSEHNLSKKVRQLWVDMGLTPDTIEYKSSSIKSGDEQGQIQRNKIGSLLHHSAVAFAICPNSDRKNLGNYCIDLVLQLIETGKLEGHQHDLFLDENIYVNQGKIDTLKPFGISCHLNQDSLSEAGIQLADHVSHALGGMLLEELGVLTKEVKAGGNSGYDPEMLLNIGFELWAGLRYSLVGNNEPIEGFTDDEFANPYFKVEGYGLYIAPTCEEPLRSAALKRFGINYLGCIH